MSKYWKLWHNLLGWEYVYWQREDRYDSCIKSGIARVQANLNNVSYFKAENGGTILLVKPIPKHGQKIDKWDVIPLTPRVTLQEESTQEEET